MTAAPAPESSSATARPTTTYEVFLSFRGEDTRGSFTSHLHAALLRTNIRAYIDDRLDERDEIGQLLMEATEKLHLAVVIYSKNYASSKWCLDELVKIMECKKTEQIVIPVFYNIDQSLGAQGLGYSHASTKKVIYRDFKCSNILLDGAYNAKISDFGLAKFDFHGDTESMALGGFASNNKDEVTSKIINDANKEKSQKSEGPENCCTMNASIRQSQSPTKGNNQDDDSNPFGLSGSILRSQHKRKENMGKFCSSLATLTFALFMLFTILGHPLKEKQGSFISILVSLLAVFNLIAFIFAVSLMILVRWQFTSLQIATMLISAMAIRVVHSNLVISLLFMLMEAPILAMLSLLWNS